MKKQAPYILLILFIIAAIGIWLNQNPKIAEIKTTAMYALLEIKVYGPEATASARKAETIIKNLSKEFSWFDPKTQISLINDLAGKDGVEVGPNLLEILTVSKQGYQKTSGTFNIAIGPLVNLWKKSKQDKKIPSSSQIEAAKQLCLDQDFIINQKEKIVRLKKVGMSLDLGGVAKGLAIQKALDRLKGRKTEAAIISMGSSIGVMGKKPDGSDWKIGVKHPRELEKLLGTIVLDNGQALSTSGDYEQDYFIDGRRFSHILDPKTGIPANKCQSVTVVAQNAGLAEIYSTAIFVMGPWDGFRFAESQKDLEVLIVKADGNLITTPGLKFKRETDL